MANTQTHAATVVRDAAVAVLDQLRTTLDAMDDAHYTTPGPGGATVGAHVRHTLDHFRKLVDGYARSAVVAYDRRERGGTVETLRASAIAEAKALSESIADLDETQVNFPIRICAMVCGEGTEAEIDSTLLRELWFATHHAIHHNALLKPIASACGMDLPVEFGRAPSTVNNERA